ncbi:PAS domain S-box protein [Aurantibacter crassamenti]|uniref:PAS domain-containing sensor histidine kinase n=1 Tax=Aurantibacter crassamenti TaxID=1837375 RepID=UPI00193A0611|nr:PAS domain S-box protein [Aurantibacter crassamenti]MBM1105588.1 PAS domain S-box protein [Aurantibacter crassamenti]
MIKNNPISNLNLTWLEQVPSSIALLDTNFCLIDASEQWFSKFSFLNKDVKGLNILDIFPGLSDNWKTKLEYALDGLKDIQIIDKGVIEEGNESSFIWYLNPWKDGYGNNIGVVVSIKDVTETKKLQIELNHTNKLLRQNGNIAKIGSWEFNVEKEEVFLSPKVKDIFKIQHNSLLTLRTAINFFKKGSSRDKMEISIHKAINSGTPWDENLEIISANGSTIWVNAIGRPKFKDGKCARIIGTIQDVTSKFAAIKNEKKEAVESNFEYQQFFKASPIGMAVTDYSTGKFLEVNDEFCNVTGYSFEELIGKSYKSFQLLSDASDKSSMLKQLSVTNMFELTKLNYTAKNGEERKINLFGRIISNSNENKRIITTLVNVSARNNQSENLLKQVNDANENVDKLVNFTHMVSHNLKGHATNITLLLNFIEKEDCEIERKKLLSILKDGNENMTETIKGLREIVSISNNNKLKKEFLVVNDFIYRAEQRLTGLVKNEKAKIINEIGDDFEIKALSAYLENIVVNCLSNAIKFRKPDKIPVVIISAEKNKTHSILSIEDNGIGIDLNKNGNKLFKLYKTLGNNGEARGMGLYLTKYQVDLMKGKIEVESTLGEGTTFRIFFPNK